MSATQAALTQLLPLAGDTFDKNKVTPGLLGFVIFALIGLSLWWLMKNMNKQFKKIDFEEQPEQTEQAGQAAGQPSEPAKASAASGAEGPGRKG